MDIKYPIENEYMKCVLQINGFSGLRPRVRSSRRVGSSQGGGGAGDTRIILLVVSRQETIYYACWVKGALPKHLTYHSDLLSIKNTS